MSRSDKHRQTGMHRTFSFSFSGEQPISLLDVDSAPPCTLGRIYSIRMTLRETLMPSISWPAGTPTKLIPNRGSLTTQLTSHEKIEGYKQQGHCVNVELGLKEASRLLKLYIILTQQANSPFRSSNAVRRRVVLS
jgi:hypothetical protein